MTKHMTADDVRGLLRKQIEAEGTAAAWCRKHGVNSQNFVSQLLIGRIDPPPIILGALGLERVVSYRRVGE